MMQDGSEVLAIYPEFVEDLAIQLARKWIFAQVKTHLASAPPWTLSAVLHSGAFGSIWRTAETLRSKAPDVLDRSDLQIWLSGPLQRGRLGKRNLITVFTADHARPGLRRNEAVQHVLDDCSEDEAHHYMGLAAAQLRRAAASPIATPCGCLGPEEASWLVENVSIVSKPSLDSVFAATLRCVHAAMPTLARDELDRAMSLLAELVRRRASGIATTDAPLSGAPADGDFQLGDLLMLAAERRIQASDLRTAVSSGVKDASADRRHSVSVDQIRAAGRVTVLAPGDTPEIAAKVRVGSIEDADEVVVVDYRPNH